MLFGCSNNFRDTELSYEIDLEKTEIGYPVNPVSYTHLRAHET